MRMRRGVIGLAAMSMALAVLAPAAARSDIHPRGGARRGAAAAVFAAALPAPAAGDVSYAVAQVRILPRSSRPPGLEGAAGPLVYAGRVGGLSIAVRSPDWSALRASTRVYVVASRVAGARASVRDLAVFVVRRRTRGRMSPPTADAEFTLRIANATPAVGSFWVRGVDRRGMSRVFAVRNMLATAVANWGRYLRVLRAADALTAAARPLGLTPTARHDRAAVQRTMSVWVGGQHPTRRVRAIIHILRDAIGNPLQYAAVKRSPLIADFIARELGNPALARRWRQVTASLPLQVPDRYAAAAQEEARFGHVRAPNISHAVVAMDDGTNSSSQLGADDPDLEPKLVVQKLGTGDGSVAGSEYVYGPNIDCGLQCSASFASGAASETLTATAGPGSAFAGWSGCDQILASGKCWLEAGGINRLVIATFNLAYSIHVILAGPQADQGVIRSDPKGISCNSQGGSGCVAVFSPGQQVTLTLDPSPHTDFEGWTGCDDTGSDFIHKTYSCTVQVSFTGRQVTATLGNATGPAITRFAGSGSTCQTPPDCGDNGAATGARLAFPKGVAASMFGDLYIADTFDQEVRKVDPNGTITTVAGTGTPCSTTTCGDGGPATSAQLSNPAGVAVSANGILYIADTSDHEVRKVALDGTITTFAGDGNFCASPPDCGDGSPATRAQLNRPSAVAVDDASGYVYIADTGDNEIRQVAPDGTITRLAGTGRACTTAPSCGDGGPEINARLTAPTGLTIGRHGVLYVADTGDNEVRAVSLSLDATIEPFAGDGSRCAAAPACGDDGPAASAQLSSPSGLALDPSGTLLYIAAAGDNEVRRVDLNTLTISRVAGDGTRCSLPPSCNDGADAITAMLSAPSGVALDRSGNLYIADTQDQEIRAVG